MSNELKTFLLEHGISTSRTTPYNPRGNGQCERYNGIIWKTINLALQSLKLPVTQWESMIPVAMHSIRSLLCTATNQTPHERFFNFARRSVNGQSTPSWLLIPGPMLMKKHVKESKYDPCVEEVELLSANPNYANIRTHTGLEKTVSIRDLAPISHATEDVQENADLSDYPLIEKLPNTKAKLIHVLPKTKEKPGNEEQKLEDKHTKHLARPTQEISDHPPNHSKIVLEEEKTEGEKMLPDNMSGPRRPQRLRKSPDRYRP